MAKMYAIEFFYQGEKFSSEFIMAASAEDALSRVEQEGLVPPLEYEVEITEL